MSVLARILVDWYGSRRKPGAVEIHVTASGVVNCKDGRSARFCLAFVHAALFARDSTRFMFDLEIRNRRIGERLREEAARRSVRRSRRRRRHRTRRRSRRRRRRRRSREIHCLNERSGDEFNIEPYLSERTDQSDLRSVCSRQLIQRRIISRGWLTDDCQLIFVVNSDYFGVTSGAWKGDISVSKQLHFLFSNRKFRKLLIPGEFESYSP